MPHVVPQPLKASRASQELRRARFAGFSRLLACALDEGLLSAYRVDIKHPELEKHVDIVSWCTIGSTDLPGVPQQFGYLVGLLHHPIHIKPASALEGDVPFLHPRDLSDCVYQIVDSPTGTNVGSHGHLDVTLTRIATSQSILTSVVESDFDSLAFAAKLQSVSKIPIDPASLSRFETEVASSIHHVTHAFLHSPPTPDLATGSPILWEQSIVEGHMTHPLHKSRCPASPLPKITVNDTEKLHRPDVVFVAVPRGDIRTRGDYERQLARILPSERIPAGFQREDGWEILPVHSLQIPNIRDKFPAAVVLKDVRISTLAQASLRSVVPTNQVPEIVSWTCDETSIAEETLALKLSLGINITSALRTITPLTCYQGPGFLPIVDKLQRLVPDNKLLVWPELASIWPTHEDEDIAKHMACIFRAERYPRGERVMITAALTERDPATGLSRCEAAFGLHTPEARERFLRVYVDGYFSVFLTTILKAGFTFEGHQQNVLLRVRRASPGSSGGDLADGWDFAGFAVRDLGGIKVHADTMRATIGEELDVLAPEAYANAESMTEVSAPVFSNARVNINISPSPLRYINWPTTP